MITFSFLLLPPTSSAACPGSRFPLSLSPSPPLPLSLSTDPCPRASYSEIIMLPTCWLVQITCIVSFRISSNFSFKIIPRISLPDSSWGLELLFFGGKHNVNHCLTGWFGNYSALGYLYLIHDFFQLLNVLGIAGLYGGNILHYSIHFLLHLSASLQAHFNGAYISKKFQFMAIFFD